jgi:hypothetical protein
MFSNTSFQVISDLHIEFGKRTFKEYCITSAANLLIAGDIGYPNEEAFKCFLGECSINFERVFFVAGNHEYYNCSNQSDQKMDFEYINNKLESMCESFTNVHFLNRNAYESSQYIILGCTLWSEIPNKYAHIARSAINDFKHIYYKTESKMTKELDVKTFNAWHITVSAIDNG